ncbi:MAG: hypothetical protein ABIP39_05020 [Polyangiaceae bacterium]
MRTPVLSFVLIFIAACSKPEDAKPADPPAPVPSAAPSVSVATSASAAPTEAPSAAPSAVASATASAAVTTKPGPAAPACGSKPLPDCPLQGWMKTNTAPAMAAGDLPALATAFDHIVKFAPAGYTNWASIAKDGAKAGREGQLDAVKAACRGCHDQYKTKYKTEIRSRAIL